MDPPIASEAAGPDPAGPEPATRISGTSVDCAHCGLPAPPAPAEQPAFCCGGCRAAWNMLHAAGLGGFYPRRARLGEAPSHQPATAPEPGRYAHFDTPEFQARFVDAQGGVALHVDGVHCAACVWVMEQLPSVVPGVAEARLDYGRARLHLRFDPAQVPLSAVADFLHGLGYRPSASGVEAEAARQRADRRDLLRLGTMFAVMGNTMMIAVALYAGADSGVSPAMARLFEWASLGLAGVAVTYGAWPFYRGAWAGLRLRVPHIDLPISIGLLVGFGASAWHTISGSLGASVSGAGAAAGSLMSGGAATGGAVYYDSVTTLVFLLLLGRFVQARGQRAAMSRTELLATLLPGSAQRWAGEAWTAVPAASLRPGDRVRVCTGEVLPADGRVVAGAGHLDQSLLTGEGAPVPVAVGASVFAGTRVAGAELELEVLAASTDTRLGRLVADLERNDAARAPIVQQADRLSGRFVVVILTLAALGGLVWAFIDPTRVFAVVVSLLVVTCPCALGLATPVALAVARGRAAASGVLVRSTAAIERLAAVDHVWFDKTGTLTEGRLTVTTATLCDPADRARIVALERQARHPIGRAVVAWGEASARVEDDAASEGLQASAVQEVLGQGIEGVVEGHRMALKAPGAPGSPAGLVAPFDGALAAALGRGETPVVVWRDDEVVGLLSLGDRLRTDATEAVARLGSLGIGVGMLSGDHPAVVARVAERLGIADARGAQSPEDKAAVVLGGRAAMVGDGFNDALALRAAGVGIAVHGGAEMALQVADLHLDRPGALAVVEAIEGARRALGLVRRNLRFSLGYNLIFASLALAGQVSPLAAAILMPISSLTVIGASVLGRSFVRRRPGPAPSVHGPGQPGEGGGGRPQPVAPRRAVATARALAAASPARTNARTIAGDATRTCR